MPERQLRPFIHADRLRYVFAQVPVSMIVTLLNALFTAVVLEQVTSHTHLFVWLVSLVVLSALRMAGASWFRRDRSRCEAELPPRSRHQSAWRRLLHSDRLWAGISVSGALLSGAIWGVGAAWLFPEPPIYHLFLAFVIGGMCAGAVTVSAPHLPTMFAFILPACLPLALRLMLEGDPLHVVMGSMLLVFVVTLTRAGVSFSFRFGQMLDLNVKLAERTRELHESNRRLTAEMDERRTTEAALRQAQKMEAVGGLTAGLAHDFNNLLLAIGGTVELMQRRRGIDAQESAHLGTIEAAVRRGETLARQLLAFARRQVLHPRSIDINAVLRSLSKLLVTTLGGNVTVLLRLAPDLWPAFVDPNQIEHAVLNLAINGRDAMPDGGTLTIVTGNITVPPSHSAEQDTPPGDYVVISVADTGTGMSEEVQQRACDPFFSTKPPGRGSGLGLSQVYGVVKQSGGVTRIDTAPGKGTVVQLLLPRAAAEPEPERPALEPERQAEPALPEPLDHASCVLMLDDDPLVRSATGALLREAGYEVLLAGTFDEATALLEHCPEICLVVLDFGMPDITGDKAAQSIRDRRPSLPILFMTGCDAVPVLRDERWQIHKPFRAAALLQTIASALRENEHTVC